MLEKDSDQDISFFMQRMDNIVAIVSDGHYNQTCGGQYPGPTQVCDAVLFLCAPGTKGSNITILKSTTETDILKVCEVEVFSNP